MRPPSNVSAIKSPPYPRIDPVAFCDNSEIFTLEIYSLSLSFVYTNVLLTSDCGVLIVKYVPVMALTGEGRVN